VQEAQAYKFGWISGAPDPRTPQRVVGYSECYHWTKWDVWWGKYSTGCSQSHQETYKGAYEDFPWARDWGEAVCNVLCQDDNRGVKDRGALTCSKLKAYAETQSIMDPAGPWNYKAICEAPKGIVAVLTLALVMAALGFCMCFACSSRPKLLLIPAALDCILAAIGPIAYGAAVASVYPWEALKMDEMLTTSVGGASAAASDVAQVRSGFALAITASVTALVGIVLLIYNLYFVKASSDQGHELSIMSAVPVQPTDVLAPPRGEAPEVVSGPLQATAAASSATTLDNTPSDTEEDRRPAATAPAITV